MAYTPKEKILTEQQLLEWWQITGDQLDTLRRDKGLPHVKLTRSNRIYLEKSLAKWGANNEEYIMDPKR